jgi:hypothetical protein
MTVIIDPSLAEPTRAAVPVPGQRYFQCDDNGCYYTFVAIVMDHAKRLLAESRLVTVAESDAGRHGIVPVEWSEIDAERAARITCDDMEGHRGPLTEFGPGDWFTSEY